MKFGQVTNLDSIEFNLPEIPNRTKKLLNKSKSENLVFSQMDIVKSIEKYNYVDVKVIDEIVDYLRTKI